MVNKLKEKLGLECFFKAKEEFHKSLAKLPFERKIEILVRLQEIAQNFSRSNQKKRVWKIEEKS